MSARYVVGIDLGTTHTALAVAPIAGEGVGGGPGLRDSPARRASFARGPRAPAVVSLLCARERGRAGAPVGRDRTLRRRRVRALARARRAGAPHQQRQELALARRHRSPRRHPAARRAGRRREDFAGRGLVALPRAPRRGVGRHVRRRKPRARALRTGGRAHGAGLVRRLGARAHGRSGARRGARAPDPARGAAGRALRVDRWHGPRHGARRSRWAT